MIQFPPPKIYFSPARFTEGFFLVMSCWTAMARGPWRWSQAWGLTVPIFAALEVPLVLFFKLLRRFSSVSPRRVLQRSKGVCQPDNLGYTEQMESTNFPLYLTLSLVQKICPTPESLKHAEHLQEYWGLCYRTPLWSEATRGLKVLKSDWPHTWRGSKRGKGLETVNSSSSKKEEQKRKKRKSFHFSLL